MRNLFVIAMFLTQLNAKDAPPSIFGAYQECAMACQTIQIRGDHTLVYRLSGDLYGDQRFTGTWTWLGSQRLRILIPPDTSAPDVSESVGGGGDDFEVTVIDVAAAPSEGVTITPLNPETRVGVRTNSQGQARIPRCRGFEIRVSGYAGRYFPTNAASNRFLVSLTVDQMQHIEIDETWQVANGRLSRVGEDGVADKVWALRKLSKKQERSIFGTALN